jgi:hypothetical protein
MNSVDHLRIPILFRLFLMAQLSSNTTTLLSASAANFAKNQRENSIHPKAGDSSVLSHVSCFLAAACRHPNLQA